MSNLIGDWWPSSRKSSRKNPRKLPPDAFRKPNKSRNGTSVWYGPGGKKGDVATEVIDEGNGWYAVSQYQHVAGYFDTYDKNEPFLKISTTVQAKSAREAATLGVAKIGERGGDESMEAELP